MASDTDPATALAPLLARVRALAERFDEAGHRTHLVGGAVRDALLGHEHLGDLDLTTDARPDQIEEIVRGWADAVWTQGARFGTIGARWGEDSFEITTHRTEAYEPGSRKPRVDFADELVTDLSRRDFTINAMAADALTGELIDPFDGRGDLERRVLRTPLDPETSFTDDPLRMLRAARFMTRFGLDVEPGLRDAARRLTDRIGIVSAERVREELLKLLETRAPAPGLAFLDDIGLLDAVLPEASLDSPVDDAPADACDRLAVLLVGNPADAVRRRLRALRCSTEEQRTVDALVDALATAPTAGSPLSEGDIRRWVRRVGPRRGRALRLLQLLDPAGGAELERRIAALAEVEDLDDLHAPIDGGHIMAVLDLAPGPQVGRLLSRLTEHRLDHGPFGVEEAEALVREWADD